MAFAGLGEGGRREVYCGESILGSDFHLLFTCWVLFMLPAVSQSGGGVCQGSGVRGSVGRGLGTISPSGSAQGDCLRCSGGWGGCFQEKEKDENVRRGMKSHLQTGEMGSRDFPWSPVGLWERGDTALAWILEVPSLWADPVGDPRGGRSLVHAIWGERSQSQLPRTRLSFERKELWEKIDLPCDWLVNF